MATVRLEESEDDAFGNPLLRRGTWMNKLEAISWFGGPFVGDGGEDIENMERNSYLRLAHEDLIGSPSMTKTNEGLSSIEDANFKLSSSSSFVDMGAHRQHVGHSMSASPTRYRTPLQRALPMLVKILRCILASNTQICVVNICFCCFYSYVGAWSRTYVDHDVWQACFVRVGGMEQQTDLSFISAAAGYGCQVAVYSTASIIIVSHALHHTALLPSTVPMVVYQVLCILSYFSLQHVIPWPTELEATLVSMTIYVRPSMYDGLHMGATCDGAYKFNLAYLILNFASLVLVILVLSIAIYADVLRRKTLPAARVGFAMKLKLAKWPQLISQLTVAGYIVSLVGKTMCASMAINTFQSTIASTFYPGAQTSLDPTTIFLVLTSMAVIRGSLASSSSAFRLGAGSSVVFVATLWPSFVSACAVVVKYELFTEHGCQKFFEGQLAWGVPDKRQSRVFCTATRTSFVGTCIIFLCMHAQVIACIACFSANRKKNLGDLGLAPPPNAHDMIYGGSGHGVRAGINNVDPDLKGFSINQPSGSTVAVASAAAEPLATESNHSTNPANQVGDSESDFPNGHRFIFGEAAASADNAGHKRREALEPQLQTGFE